MRLLAALLLVMTALAGCASDVPDTDSTGTPDAPLPLVLAAEAPTVDAAAVLADLGVFAPQFSIRTDNHADHEGARQWLADTMAGYGLEVYRQNFTNGIDQANIVGIKWGEVRDQWVIVGAHYDTMTDDCLAGTGVGPAQHGCPLRQGSQGAYDDGSGTMMTVHLAKAFAQLNTTYTMAFVLYDGEERGTQGAAAFVNAFVTGNGEGNYSSQPYGKIKVVGAVDLDMIGLNWPGVNAPINVLTNSDYLWTETKNITGQMSFPEGQIMKKTGLQLGSSDYAQFWRVTPENGGPIPTIFFIADFEELGAPAPAPEQAHTPEGVGAYPFWHFFDTMETMTVMAGGADNLQAGFQSAVNIASHLLWRMAVDGDAEIDAVVMP